MQALDPIQFIKELVATPSVSGNETAAAELVVREMRALGYFEAYVDEAGSPIGRWGQQGASRRIMLVGHVDTVPGEIPVRIEEVEYESGCGQPEPVLFGRGSVDAKGPLSVFVQAVARMPKDCDVELVVVGAVEEEVASSKGANQLLQDFSEPECVIIGEPSGTRGVTLGYKGRFCSNIQLSRSMTHSAHAHISAAELAFLLHEIISAEVGLLNCDKKGIFQPLDYSVQSLNTSSDGLVETANMQIGFRLGPAFLPDEIAKLVDASLSKLSGKVDMEIACKSEEYCAELPAQFDRRGRLAQVFRKVIREEGLEPKMLLKTGTSDMNILSRLWKCPMVAYGPGDSKLDHTPEERLQLNSYEQAIRVLVGVLGSFVN